MKIVLADPPRKESYYDLSYPNVGILYLVSYLEKHADFPLEILYLEGHCDLNGHLEIIKRFEPDLYGISFAMWTQELAMRTINAVKTLMPDMPVICGGPQPTSSYGDIMSKCKVDICVLGEGEQTFLELVEHFHYKNNNLEDIPGLAVSDNSGGVSVTPKRPYIKDLDSIPFPAWESVDFNNYHGMHINQSSPQTHIVVSRGCPYDCNFCANPVWKYNRPWVRMRSPANISQEISLLYDRGIREIYMTSDEFNVSERWALEVCNQIESLNLKDIFFQCNVRADIFTPDLAESFKRINLWLLHLGIESGNQRTLNGIGKKVTLAQIKRTCGLCRENGISVFGFVMLFHVWEEHDKLCWETPKEVDNTLIFCRQLLAKGLLKYMSWQVATPMPGSRLWNTALKYCLIPDKTIDNIWSQNILIPGICEREIKNKLRKGIIWKNYYLLRNGNLNLSHLDRAWRNLRVLLGLNPT